jgi:hypothetical protein
MAISKDRLDRFTFMTGQLTEITDPVEIAEINRKIGFVPPSKEEQDWIASEGCRRWKLGNYASTDELRAEYARRKALGTL